MSDLLERMDLMRKSLGSSSPQWQIITEAMKEIERLRSELIIQRDSQISAVDQMLAAEVEAAKLRDKGSI